jgi:uncharacterized membrane protein YfcA
MDTLTPLHVALLLLGGLVAGVVNTLAGGGSLLTVPLLVLVGLPGTVANGTNRIGILLQSAAAAWSFRSRGVFEPRAVGRVMLPVGAGAGAGALWAAQLADATFERVFGVLMLVLLVPTLRRPPAAGAPGTRLGPVASAALFFGVGLYAGAFQAGVGIPLLFALLHAGWDSVRANAIKAAVVAVATLVAVPVFAAEGQIEWLPAALLAAGFTAGGSLGAHLAVGGGERLVRPVLAVAVMALAARMLGVY